MTSLHRFIIAIVYVYQNHVLKSKNYNAQVILQVYKSSINIHIFFYTYTIVQCTIKVFCNKKLY